MSDMLDDLRDRMRAARIGADGRFQTYEVADPVACSEFTWRFMGADIRRLLKRSGYAMPSANGDGYWVLTDAGREWLRDASQPTGQGGE